MSANADTLPGIPTPAPVHQHLISPAEPASAKVVRSEICTAGRKAAGFVRHVEIDVSGTPLAGNFRAGQSFGVVPPGADDKGRPHKLRLYSIASPTAGEDGKGNILATTVKRTIEEHWDDHSLFLGVCSNYLCDLNEGDEALVTGPAGKRFVLPENPADHDYVFVATGTGIAPFRGMIGDLVAAGMPSRATLIMGSPYATDLLYHDEFLRLANEHEGFTYLTSISRERQDDTDERLYVQDRLRTHADHFTPLLQSERTLVYVCGIAGMEIGVFRQLAAMLRGPELDQYLKIDETVSANPAAWERKMIPRQIKPTKRMHLEVY
ncbi:MAG: hypothetical protein RIB60_11845 [Phycisphaerales bacterium]